LIFLRRNDLELLPPKRFWTLIFIFTFVGVGIYSYFWFRLQPPPERIRIAIFPFEYSGPNDKSWLRYIPPEIGGEILKQQAQGKYLAYPLGWYFEAADYPGVDMRSFSKKIKADIGTFGTIQVEENRITVSYFILKIASNQKLDSAKVEILGNDWSGFTRDLVSRVLSKSGFPFSADQAGFLSMKNYEKYILGRIGYFTTNGKDGYEELQRAFQSDSSQNTVRLSSGFYGIDYGAMIKDNQKPKTNKLPAGVEANRIYREAEYQARQVLKTDSSNGDAWRLWGEYYLAREEFGYAQGKLKRALKLEPDEPMIYYDLSFLEQSRIREVGFDDAGKLYEKAVYLNPAFIGARISLADFYMKNGGIRGTGSQNALNLLLEAYELNPHSERVELNLALTRMLRKEWEEAAKLFTQVYTDNPKNSVAVYNLGICYYETKQIDLAFQLFQRAVEFNTFPDSYLYLGYLYEIKGDSIQAIENYRQRIRLRSGPDDKFADEAAKALRRFYPEY
jgi:tetratricopeptide (TPR) repeat protein